MGRKDGRRVKNVDPMYAVASYIMDKRYDAMNMIEVHIPLRGMNEYIKRKRSEGAMISHLALVISAYLRTAAQMPLLNRFVVNKRIYARNEFAVGMVVLKPGETDGTMNKMYFEMTDDIFAVQSKIDEYVSTNRETGETNKTDKLIKVLLGVPGLVNFGVWAFKKLDKYGLLPKKIIDASPFHTSLVISNLASIRTNHIYHHCYEFGTTSVVLTMGNSVEVPKKSGDGIAFEKCLPLGIVMDERICSGSYFAKAFKLMRGFLNDPTKLEGAPEIVVRDE